MKKLWRAVVLIHNRVEYLSRLMQEVAMIQTKVAPVKHDISDLILALKDSEVNMEAIPVHIHQSSPTTR